MRSHDLSVGPPGRRSPPHERGREGGRGGSWGLRFLCMFEPFASLGGSFHSRQFDFFLLFLSSFEPAGSRRFLRTNSCESSL